MYLFSNETQRGLGSMFSQWEGFSSDKENERGYFRTYEGDKLYSLEDGGFIPHSLKKRCSDLALSLPFHEYLPGAGMLGAIPIAVTINILDSKFVPTVFTFLLISHQRTRCVLTIFCICIYCRCNFWNDCISALFAWFFLNRSVVLSSFNCYYPDRVFWVQPGRHRTKIWLAPHWFRNVDAFFHQWWRVSMSSTIDLSFSFFFIGGN